ncbi:hypothetical protein V8G54_010677 [Vigna mungo]|uniref:Uncharacterized protein n=1 Tax=Vigna mungo TaxID=3915 RepID=A0AAQ3NYG0_VIGMU
MSEMALTHGGLKRMQEMQMFYQKMKEAQKAAMEKRWEDFKKNMMENQANILIEFDLLGNNSIHIATRSHPQLLKEIIQMAKETTEVVFKFEELLMEEQRLLPELRNNRGESPLFVIAMYGNLKILKNMAKRVGTMDNLRKHFRRSDKYNALHASVIGQHFQRSPITAHTTHALDRPLRAAVHGVAGDPIPHRRHRRPFVISLSTNLGLGVRLTCAAASLRRPPRLSPSPVLPSPATADVTRIRAGVTAPPPSFSFFVSCLRENRLRSLPGQLPFLFLFLAPLTAYRTAAGLPHHRRPHQFHLRGHSFRTGHAASSFSTFIFDLNSDRERVAWR